MTPFGKETAWEGEGGQCAGAERVLRVYSACDVHLPTHVPRVAFAARVLHVYLRMCSSKWRGYFMRKGISLSRAWRKPLNLKRRVMSTSRRTSGTLHCGDTNERSIMATSMRCRHALKGLPRQMAPRRDASKLDCSG